MSGSCRCGIKKTSRIVGGSETEVKFVFSCFLFVGMFLKDKLDCCKQRYGGKTNILPTYGRCTCELLGHSDFLLVSDKFDSGRLCQRSREYLLYGS